MHVGVAGANEFTVHGVGRPASHEQHRQPAPVHIVHGVGGIRGADIDVDEHPLTAAGHQRVARRHMAGGVLVRAAHDFGHCFAASASVCHFLDDRRVIGAEVTKQILDTDFFEAFEQIIGGGEIPNIAPARG